VVHQYTNLDHTREAP